jgi:hypothetical protein
VDFDEEGLSWMYADSEEALQIFTSVVACVSDLEELKRYTRSREYPYLFPSRHLFAVFVVAKSTKINMLSFVHYRYPPPDPYAIEKKAASADPYAARGRGRQVVGNARGQHC